jgi:hypothetical protein
LDKIVYNTSFNPDLTTFDIVLTDTDSRPEKYNAVRIYPKLNSYLNSHLKDFDGKVKEISAFIRKN